MHNPNVLPSCASQKYKHIWFGAISFEEDLTKNISNYKQLWNSPELVVVVYLRFGDGGKEAAPIATQIIQKYREIKKKYTSNN